MRLPVSSGACGRVDDVFGRIEVGFADLEANEVAALSLREIEDLAIKRALESTGGSVTKAAKLLGMGRATLYRRLAKTRETTATGE